MTQIFSDIEVQYVDHMGGDLTVVNSARVSFDKRSEKLSASDEKLIEYLARHRHFTPFTHPQITLRYTLPVFIARQEFKHIVGFTRNEVSRRYVSDPPTFYRPDEWRSKPGDSIKQGSGSTHEDSHYYRSVHRRLVESSLSEYKEMIEDGVAPEQARMILPQSMMTEYYITGSLSAYARMYQLRKPGTHAQKEIQGLAEMVSDNISPLFPVSWKALTDQG